MNKKDFYQINDQDILEFDPMDFKDLLLSSYKEPSLLSNYGSHLSAIGNLPQAETFFRKALDTAPENEAIRYNLAIVFLRQSKFKNVIELLTEVKPSENLDSLFNLQIGTSFLALGEFNNALNFLIKASKMLPDSKQAQYNLFRVAEETRNFDIASEAYQKYMDCINK